MIPKEIKEKIDGMDYESMLRKWRFAPVGDSMFEGETGDYFQGIMLKKKAEIGDEAAVAASKRVGWKQ